MNPPEQLDNVDKGGGDRLPVEEEPVNKNPLLINVVLETLLHMVPLDQLKTARLVCKSWWESSLPQWRKNCVVQIQGDFQDDKRRTVKASAAPHPSPYSIQDFLEFRGKWGGAGDPFQFEKFPFRKFNLSCVNLNLSTSKNVRGSSIQLEFWKRVGGEMTHLTVRKSVFNNLQTFKGILFEATPKLEALQLVKNYYKGSPRFRSHALGQARPPQFVKNCQGNLKEMSIVLREFDAEALHSYGKCDPIELPLSWAQFLSYFPNVVNVHLENIDSEDYSCPSLEGFLESVINLRRGSNTKALNLNVLDIMNAKTNSLFTLPIGVLFHLKGLHWPLTSLTLDVGVSGSNVFGEILHIHSTTLKSLTVFRAPYVPPFSNFPFGVHLNYLEELKVIGPICRDLLFLEFMPQLKRLIITEENIHKPFEFAIEPADRSFMEYKNPESIIKHTDFSLIPYLVVNTLVEFNGGDEQVCPMEKVNALARLMPNLKILELKVVGAAGAVEGLSCADVTQNWRGLEKVNVVIQHDARNVGDHDTLLIWLYKSIDAEMKLDGLLTTENVVNGYEIVNDSTLLAVCLLLELQLGKDVEFTDNIVFRASGELMHYCDCPNTIWWTVPKQTNQKAKLETIMPDVEYNQIFITADTEASQAGNFSEVPTLKALQRMKEKRLEMHGLDSGVARDLAKQMKDLEEIFNDEYLPRYLQTFAVVPKRIPLYTKSK